MNNHTTLTHAIAAARRRIAPFFLLMFVLAFLDRVNVGFAKEAFQADTGIGNGAFALGAGLFFVGYAVFETPSNIILHRVGARRWMARIMVTWGLISAAMAFVHSTETFYAARLLLGAAEAGFFPGAMLFFTYWFPEGARGKVLGLFYFGPPLAFILGGPLSGALLGLDTVGGLHGWQWMFAVEGALAVVVGVIAFWYLDDRPSSATWLTIGQRASLAEALAQEDAAKPRTSPVHSLRLLMDPRILYCSLVFFLIQVSVYGVTFYLPSQVAHVVGQRVGLLVGTITAVPWLCSLAACYLIPSWSDRTGERRWTATLTLACGAVGIFLASGVFGPWIAFCGLCIAAAGFLAVQPLYFAFPMHYLTGDRAAPGLGIISSLAAFGAFTAPNIRYLVESGLQSTTAGFYVLSLLTLVGAALIAAFPLVGLSAGVRPHGDGLQPRANTVLAGQP